MDYYGELLTEKQKDIMNLYFNDDLSLAEISEITNTSRQAIHDTIKRCQKQLEHYEAVLRLLNKNLQLEEFKTNIISKIDSLQKNKDEDNRNELVNDIKKYIIENL